MIHFFERFQSREKFYVGEDDADGSFEGNTVHHHGVEGGVDKRHLFALAGENVAPLDDDDGDKVGGLGVFESLC